MMKKLSKRLQCIFNMASLVEGKRYIYDICCDHGHLAYHLWKYDTPKYEKVFAVDCAPKVIESLSFRYKDLTDERFIIEHDYGQEIKYLNQSTVIIAGVGAHTSIKIIDYIQGLGQDNIDIICCCHQNIDLLRGYLNEDQSIGVVTESLVFENEKFYELIHIRRGAHRQVSLIGDELWEKSNDAKKYFDSQLRYWNMRRDDKAIFYRNELLEKKEKWGF